MKHLNLRILFLFFPGIAFTQNKVEPTDAFTIMGLVDSAITVSFSDIAQEKSIEMDSFVIENHLGEIKKVYQHIKAVALLPVLQQVNIPSASPKLLSEYYLVFRCADNYAAVYSWNEIFNTDIGKSLFVVIEIDHVKQTESGDRILLISTMDYRTGRRHLKGLKTIEIKRI